MKNQIFVFSCMVACVLFLGCKPEGAESPASIYEAASAMTKQDSINRGAYLVTVMGCNDCHTPKIFTPEGAMLFDSTKLLSGHQATEALPKITDKAMIAPGQWVLFSPNFTAMVGPWGTSFSGNLTPHESGTGLWTYEQFTKVLREGKFKGMDNGRPIMPPMPWENFRHMTDADMSAIWAYLRSIPPVNNVVPTYVPPGQG